MSDDDDDKDNLYNDYDIVGHKQIRLIGLLGFDVETRAQSLKRAYFLADPGRQALRTGPSLA